jgi:hypothetical protein
MRRLMGMVLALGALCALQTSSASSHGSAFGVTCNLEDGNAYTIVVPEPQMIHAAHEQCAAAGGRAGRMTHVAV